MPHYRTLDSYSHKPIYPRVVKWSFDSEFFSYCVIIAYKWIVVAAYDSKHVADSMVQCLQVVGRIISTTEF